VVTDANQVQLVYCSSDGWNGNARAVSYDTTHPITGQPVRLSLHFLGSKSLEAELTILHRDGVAGRRGGADARSRPMVASR